MSRVKSQFAKQASKQAINLILLSLRASYLHICKLNDPKRDECIRESIQTLLPELRKGHDNIDLPPIDPFVYDSVSFNYKNSQLLTGQFTLKNVKTFGMSRGKVQSVKSDFTDDEMTIHADVFIPKIFSTGNYKSNMTFNAFKMEAKGQYNVTMKQVTAKWNIKGKLVSIDGEDYMNIYHFDITPEANDMKISVSGIFPDENLSECNLI